MRTTDALEAGARAERPSTLGCFKLPSFHLCTRVDLEQRARYPWIDDCDAAEGADDLDDVGVLDGAVPRDAGPASGSFCSVSSRAQVLPKKLTPEDWPVRQPSFEDADACLIQTEVDGSPLAPTPGTPPAVDAPPKAPSPSPDDEPSASQALLLLPKPIKTTRASRITFELGVGISRGSQSAKAARPHSHELAREGGRDREPRAASMELGSRRGGGRQMARVGTQTVDLAAGLPGASAQHGAHFDPLYGANRKQALPAKTVKLLVRHDRKQSWPSPAPPFENSTLYMTRRTNKHPNCQIQIHAVATGSGSGSSCPSGGQASRVNAGASKWTSEVKRAEKNIRRTLAVEPNGGDAGTAERGSAGMGREGERLPDSPETIAHLRRTWDARETSKSLHTLLAAMDVAAAVANTRCCRAGGGERMGQRGGGRLVLQGAGVRGQRPVEGPRREFDLARVLRPRGPAAFAQGPGC